MSETTTVRFGMVSTRELEIHVEPGHDVGAEFEAAVANGDDLLWVRDSENHQHGIVMDKVAFLEIESATRRDVGFSIDG
jgi:hypothetical protein